MISKQSVILKSARAYYTFIAHGMQLKNLIVKSKVSSIIYSKYRTQRNAFQYNISNPLNFVFEIFNQLLFQRVNINPSI